MSNNFRKAAVLKKKKKTEKKKLKTKASLLRIPLKKKFRALPALQPLFKIFYTFLVSVKAFADKYMENLKQVTGEI